MNRVDRLFAILLRLQHRGRVRATDLAQQFGISERTVYRDIHALNEMGVPVVGMPGEGYELLDTFKLPPLMLNPQEATALFLAGQMLVRLGEGDVTVNVETALEKIRAVLPRDARSRADAMARMIAFFPAQNRFTLDDPHLTQILDAIEEQQTLHITYQAYRTDDETARDLDPYQVEFAEGAWYVHGYCHLRQDVRSFRLNRISALFVKDEAFERRMVVPHKAKPITVTVRFSPGVIPHVRERQHYAFVDEYDGTMHYQVARLDEIRNWLLGFGAEAEVLSPESLRVWLREEAQKLIKLLT
jgi:predicted DNA-binding transcriptional regulator YafY